MASDGRLLFIRMDRIGDLVLTLPVDQHPDLLKNQILWAVASGTEFVILNAEPNRVFRAFRIEFSFRQFIDFVKWVKQLRLSAVVVFHAPCWVSWAVWLARVRLRVSPLNRISAPFFFNQTVKQKRSQSVLTELEYNYQLIEKGLGLSVCRRHPLRLSSRNLDIGHLSTFQLSEKKYFVVHPGMRGSSRNWPVENYCTLIEALSKKYCVVITGTQQDKNWIEHLKQKLHSNQNIIWLDEKLSQQQLLVILFSARGVIAPSTGVAHLAAACNTPVVGIYSPVRVQGPWRWAPHGKNVQTVHPNVSCPATYNCLGPKCPLYDCMLTIHPEHILELALK